MLRRRVTQNQIQSVLSFGNREINSHLIGNINQFKRLLRDNDKMFLENGKSNNLNMYEYSLILSYSDFLAMNINSSLRRIEKSEYDEQFVCYTKYLDIALGRIQGFNNQVVYTMFSNNESNSDFFRWWEKRINDYVRFPNFLSSSKKKWENHNLFLTITTHNFSNGKYIGNLVEDCKRNLEEEVTFKSKTLFQVQSVNQKESTIYLKESKFTFFRKVYDLHDCYIRNNRDKLGEEMF